VSASILKTICQVADFRAFGTRDHARAVRAVSGDRSQSQAC